MATRQQVQLAFEKYFNQGARIFFSPGRINLIGEHIDYNDGFVMPAAIDKGVWFAIAANDNNDANFVSADLDESFSTSLNSINKNYGWKNYVLGVLYVLQQHNYSIRGFDCAFGGNLPVGAGLSSSAAVEAGLLFALNEVFNLGIDRVKLAQFAQQAEHAYPGVKCGIMDMFASLNGKKESVILLDCTSLDYQYFPLQLKEYSIVLINTKVSHSLASGAYNNRRQSCEDGFKILKEQNATYTSFRNVPSTDLPVYKEILGDEIYNCCLFVTQEIERTQAAAKYLQQNNLVAFGKLMFDCHEGLSKLYDVSCPESDFLVDEAKKYSAVIGSRQMGGGFGGCTINIIEKEKAAEIVQTITTAYQQKFGIAAEVYEMGISDGTYEITL